MFNKIKIYLFHPKEEAQIFQVKAVSAKFGMQVVYEHMVGERKGERFTTFFEEYPQQDKEGKNEK